MMAYLTKVIADNTDWARTLVALMTRYPNIPQSRMGFVENWQCWRSGKDKPGESSSQVTTQA